MSTWREVEPGLWTNGRSFVSLESTQDPGGKDGRSEVYYVRGGEHGRLGRLLGAAATLRLAQQEAERLVPE